MATGKDDSELNAGIAAAYYFIRHFSCSHALFAGLTRRSGDAASVTGIGSHALSAGIARMGSMCGALSGSIMAAGWTLSDGGELTPAAQERILGVASRMTDWFEDELGKKECTEISSNDFTRDTGFFPYLLSMRWVRCNRLAFRFGRVAHGMIVDAPESSRGDGGEFINCVTEAVRQLTGEDPELCRWASALTAGFAGGYGLHGHVCGLIPGLCAALAMMLFRGGGGHVKGMAETVYTELFRQKRFYSVPQDFFHRFESEAGARDCRSLAGRSFSGLDDYAQFTAEGGCRDLIQSAVSLAREALDSAAEEKAPAR